ncbi:MAG TPA: hypothetical protein VN610_00540 [Bryobacteraceae bacterium]|nr:hypothetical protein [Bryobacteraceae bacterium]
MTLQYLDMAIAMTVVMLAVSLLVTIFVQTVASVCASRGRNLHRALTALIETVDPQAVDHAGEIATRVLTQKLISDSAIPAAWSRFRWLLPWRLASTIRVEELTGMLDRLAASTSADPIEKAIACVAAKREELTKWFTSAMDRASQRFVVHMRVVTVIMSIVVAFAMHLDAFHLWSQFSIDPTLRASLIDKSKTVQDEAAQALQPQSPTEERSAELKKAFTIVGELQLIPNPYHGIDFLPWQNNWRNLHLWGILFSAGLLSLGAPFWFNALKTLTALRPVVAKKVDEEQESG